jgi:uncharacterized protein (TIGR02246 family)
VHQLKKAAVLAAGLLALAGCGQKAPPAPDAAADEAAIRAINPAWFEAYNGGNVDGVVALYADDAVLSIPGAPPSRGIAAIREAYVKDMAAMAAAGLKNNQGPAPEFGVSGDLGWEWNTFSVTDAAGATVDTGKYVTVYGRRDGKWMIIRDIWNSDTPVAAPAPEAAAPAAETPAT